MDGTLLSGTTASLQIARHLGCAEDLVELEAQFAAGEIDTRGFAAAIHELWRNLTRQAVADVFGASPWLNGIQEVCADIRERGERSAVITMSPDFSRGISLSSASMTWRHPGSRHCRSA